ncbi:MAG: hypothetical protein DYG89_06010 [Caldilinea sp. CFX5]|nr:hypothetical protein [Caldilinea sp. CFX5]
MNTQPSLLHRIVRLGRLWIWVIVFFLLFLSTFANLAGQTAINNPCDSDNFTIPSDKIAFDVREGATITFLHYLCSSPKKAVTITFDISPANQITVLTSQLIMTGTSPHTVTVRALEDNQNEASQQVIIQPKAKSDDPNFDNKPMHPITVTVRDQLERLHLPIVSYNPAPTPTPPPQWRAVSGQNFEGDTLAIHTNMLFLGDRREKGAGGGIYRANFTANNCGQTLLDFGSAPLVRAQILDLVFSNDGRGLAGTFGDKAFYSKNGGNDWAGTSSALNPEVYAVTFTNRADKSYAGASDGVYLSTNRGEQWKRLADSPTKPVLTFLYNNNKLLIGTFQQGVWTLDINTDGFATIGNLPSGANEVWDIVYDDAAKQYYLATSSGVYKGDGNGNWSNFGLTGRIFSLLIKDTLLYAGLNQGGVQHSTLNQPTWTPVNTGAGWGADFTVRHLLNDSSTCKGILATTNKGVWIYR